MIFFSDVDIVLKLARCGFLDDLPGLLGEDPSTFAAAYLPSLPTRLKRDRGRTFSDEARASLERFCERHSSVDAVESLERLAELAEGGMDEGEVQLFARAEELGGCVVTGDKRALKDYAKLSGPAARKRITVVCFEMLLLRVRDLHGYAKLRSGCCRDLNADAMLRLAFRNGELSHEEDALECIRSYLRDVESHSKDIMRTF